MILNFEIRETFLAADLSNCVELNFDTGETFRPLQETNCAKSSSVYAHGRLIFDGAYQAVVDDTSSGRDCLPGVNFLALASKQLRRLNMWEDVALGIVIVCGANLFFGSILGFIGYVRYLKHKETIALAQHGIVDVRASQKPKVNPQAVRSGVITMAVGIALCIGLYPIGWIAMPGELPLNLGPWMLAGLVPFFVGLAIVLTHYLPGIQDLMGQSIQKAIENVDAEELPAGETMDMARAEQREEVTERRV